MFLAEYLRYSSNNQNFASIEAQSRAIHEYCSKNGHTIVKTYIDEALTATTDDRKEFLKMISDSANKLFDGVIVHKLDRFARNRYDSAFYKRQLKNNGVRVLSVLEQLDDSPESVILESVLEGMAEYYSQNLAREVMKGLKENALKGKHNGGTPPFGYDVDESGYYKINGSEAFHVRRIYQMYLDGFGFGSIATELNKLGVKTKVGKTFTKNAIHDILINEKYIGTMVYNRRKAHKSKRDYKPESEIIRAENVMPDIIRKNDFMKVQQKIKTNLRQPRTDAKTYYLLVGKIKCGLCGYSYSGGQQRKIKSSGKKYMLYACVNRRAHKACDNKAIRQDQIESWVIENLIENVFNDTAIDKIADNMARIFATSHDLTAGDMQVLENDKNALQVKINRLLDLYVDGNLDKKTLDNKLAELNKQLNIIASRLSELAYMKSIKSFDINIIKDYLHNSCKNLHSEDDNIKRSVIEAFVEQVTVYMDHIEVKYKIEPPPEKENANNWPGEARLMFAYSTTRKELQKIKAS